MPPVVTVGCSPQPRVPPFFTHCRSSSGEVVSGTSSPLPSCRTSGPVTSSNAAGIMHYIKRGIRRIQKVVSTRPGEVLDTDAYKKWYIIEYGSTLYVGMAQKKMAAPLNMYKI